MTTNSFALDETAIRDDARRQMEQGALTSGNTAEVERVIDVLNQVVATEMVCVMRYTQNAIAASGIDRAQVAAEFTEHANEEMQHGLRAAERVSQLGGKPDFDPATLVQRAHTQYAAPEDTDIRTMLEENLVAERIVITTYQEMVRWIGNSDPTTRRLIEDILAEEEDHADDLNDLLGN
ncbi:bacterioferritin [Prescottella equi]|uniref:ferritin-like domain-containing protein n=1 Tax=Rhodococcus hoagii TaxID=43767 RepID=UPI0009BE64CC|nr:ferritin-like domain-containing protein [Prescottella equi]OQQ27428.1 bacterioferritin [Prescottella equi]